ncbi:glycosyl hydrolase family 28-related protein [Silvibacterium dinghuense]|nr:glycosyl hydrolase family 28-related protein [Silvibacterium dinghuense]GGG99817.1 hypothetical protein GCM10011586_14240 [Silvibacterium dinghuense]
MPFRRLAILVFLCFSASLASLSAQTAPVQVQARMAQAQIQPQAVPEAPVSKFPRVDVLYRDFSSSCPNAADPTGTQDSTCALQAAIDYADSQTIGGQVASLYFPAGSYRISKSLRLPCDLQVLTDGPTASAITLAPGVRTNAITVYPPAHSISDEFLCAGGIDGLMIAGSGHENTGTLLELINASGYRLNDVKLYNGGGRGLALLGSSERIESHNLQIDAVRWPIVMTVNANEDHFYKTNIDGPGVTADGYCFNVNCVDGRFPAANAGSPTPIRPDPHGAVWMEGVNVGFYGGSIKSLEYQPAFHIVVAQSNTIANFYFENFPDHDRPNINSSVIVGGVYPSTKLTSPLNGNSASVEDTSWFPDYASDPADVQKYLANACYEQDWIMPADFAWGDSSPSSAVPGVARDQYEKVCMAGMAGDGHMYLTQRHISSGAFASTAPAGINWPAGSIVHMINSTLAYGSGVTLLSNHFGALLPGGSGYAAQCNDNGPNTCGNIIAGVIPDGYFFSASSRAAAPAGTPPASLTLIANSLWPGNQESLGTGYIKVHSRAYITILGAPPAIPLHLQTDSVLHGAETSSDVLPVVHAVQYANGTSAQVVLSRPDAGSWIDTYHGFYEQAVSTNDPSMGSNPGIGSANGHQFANSSCWFDTGTTQSPHAAHRFCLTGSPGPSAGWEFDTWNGKTWVSTFSVTDENGQGRIRLNGSLVLGASNAKISGVSGDASTLATVKGPLTPGHLVMVDANGNLRDGGLPQQGSSNIDTLPSGFGGGGGQAFASTAPAHPVTACSFDRDGLTAPLENQPVCIVPHTGTYEITLNGRASTMGSSGNLNAVRVSVATSPGAGVQSCATDAAVRLTTGSMQQFAGPCTLHIEAGQPVTVSTETSGIAGNAAYGVSVLMKQVQ